MKNWILVGTFFGLWLSTSFSDGAQTILAYLFISTVGILHGTNDINIIRTKSKKDHRSASFQKILFLYLGIIVLILTVFAFFPLIAMVLFVVFSGFHFGEQHLKRKFEVPTRWSAAIYTLYGTAILFLIFYTKVEEVIPILKQLTGLDLSEVFFKYGLIALLLLTLSSFFIFRNSLRIHIIRETFYLAVLFVVFETANLLWGFCIYFVLWHSIPSIRDQLFFLYGKADRSSLIRYFKACWPYWCISLAGLTVVYFLFRENELPLINVLLYLLASVTIPHILVMSFLESGRIK